MNYKYKKQSKDGERVAAGLEKKKLYLETLWRENRKKKKQTLFQSFSFLKIIFIYYNTQRMTLRVRWFVHRCDGMIETKKSGWLADEKKLQTNSLIFYYLAAAEPLLTLLTLPHPPSPPRTLEHGDQGAPGSGPLLLLLLAAARSLQCALQRPLQSNIIKP